MKKGFFMLELLISVALGGLIALLGAQAAVFLSMQSREVLKKNTGFLALLHASYFLERTLARAPRDKNLWSLMDATCIAWRVGNRRCSLCLEHGTLFFVERVDFERRTKAVVLKNVSTLAFNFYRGMGGVTGLSYVLGCSGQMIKGDICFAGSRQFAVVGVA